MKKLVILCVISLLISFVSYVFGQKTVWSLQDCIEYAYDNNIQIKRQELQAKIASNDYFTSKMQVLPDLNASFSRNYNYGHKVNNTTNDFNGNNVEDSYGINSNLMLFNGLQTFNAIGMNKYSMLSKLQEVEKQKVDITLQIATSYLQILFSQEILNAAKSQLEVTKLTVARTKQLVEVGNAAKGDLLEIQSQLAEEKLNVTNADNQLTLSYLNLGQLLDLDSIENFTIVIPDTLIVEDNLTLQSVYDIYNQALTFLPHIKSAEYQVQSSQKYLAIQKGKRIPQIGLYGSWGTSYSNVNPNLYGDQLNSLQSELFGIGVSVPIFNRWSVNNSISNAKINLEDSKYNLDLAKLQLFKEIQQSHSDALSAYQKYNAALEALNSYTESFQYTEQKYNVGIVNSVDYNIAKNNLIKAQAEFVRAKYDCIFKVKILDFYTGKAISLETNNN